MTKESDNAMNFMSCDVDNNLSFVTTSASTAHSGLNVTGVYTDNNSITLGCWDYWSHDYYPHVIRESYPVYIQERAKDKGKKAFEIIKILKDKRLIQVEKVSDFIDLMDELIKII